MSKTYNELRAENMKLRAMVGFLQKLVDAPPESSRAAAG